MCGRISQPTLQEIETTFHATSNAKSSIAHSINIAVGQQAFVVLQNNNVRQIEVMQFGVNLPTKFSFNARAEGYLNSDNNLNYTGELQLHTSPFYKESFAARRCLIPVTSFIEGSKIDGLNKPYSVSVIDTNAFALAAIWSIDVKTKQLGFTILTSWPNEFITKEVNHHRLPVILEDEYWLDWLDPETDVEDMATLLRPYHDDLMQAMPINPAYHSPNYHQEYNTKPPQTTLF